MSRPEVVILDLDGTLIDSNDAHARAWEEIGRRSGYEIPYARVRRLIGMGSDKLVPEVTGLDPESEEAERLKEARGDLFRSEYLPRLEPLPGARELLERLRAEGYEAVIATSAGEEDKKALLRQAGIEDLIDETTSSDDADASKPDPDIIQAALARAGRPPERAVMIGDTPYDVQASIAAGVRILAVRCGGWDDDALAGAEAVYDDPADLLAHWEQSVLGGRVGAAG